MADKSKKHGRSVIWCKMYRLSRRQEIKGALAKLVARRRWNTGG